MLGPLRDQIIHEEYVTQGYIIKQERQRARCFAELEHLAGLELEHEDLDYGMTTATLNDHCHRVTTQLQIAATVCNS
jgi:hypothetical protein